jgi:hypothetical protein
VSMGGVRRIALVALGCLLGCTGPDGIAPSVTGTWNGSAQVRNEEWLIRLEIEQSDSVITGSARVGIVLPSGTSHSVTGVRRGNAVLLNLFPPEDVELMIGGRAGSLRMTGEMWLKPTPHARFPFAVERQH